LPLILGIIALIVGIRGIKYARRAEIGKKNRMAIHSVSAEKVVKAWNYIVENAMGREKWVLERVDASINSANMPGVLCFKTEIRSGLLGHTRACVFVGRKDLRDRSIR
jgi:hypothetical protein